MIQLIDLIPTQSGLRDWEKCLSMKRVLDEHGHFLPDGKGGSKPTLAAFTDERLYIQNGHHRICAMWLAGFREMSESAFEINGWTYPDFLDFRPEVGYVTPFDPRTEVRVADFGDYKQRVLGIWKRMGVDDARMWVYRHPTYKHARNVWTVEDLITATQMANLGGGFSAN